MSEREPGVSGGKLLYHENTIWALKKFWHAILIGNEGDELKFKWFNLSMLKSAIIVS